MPEISLFFGIRVTMYYEDHQPPHFHAAYNGQKVLIDIMKGRVLRGAFPARQLKIVLAGLGTCKRQSPIEQDCAVNVSNRRKQ